MFIPMYRAARQEDISIVKASSPPHRFFNPPKHFTRGAVGKSLSAPWEIHGRAAQVFSRPWARPKPALSKTRWVFAHEPVSQSQRFGSAGVRPVAAQDAVTEAPLTAGRKCAEKSLDHYTDILK